jgi:hypothetical protein
MWSIFIFYFVQKYGLIVSLKMYVTNRSSVLCNYELFFGKHKLMPYSYPLH